MDERTINLGKGGPWLVHLRVWEGKQEYIRIQEEVVCKEKYVEQDRNLELARS